jgi:hypothetical protein
VNLGLAAVLGYAAFALYRLKLVGWWLSLAAYLAMTTSAVITFSRIDITELYRRMGMSGKQLEVLSGMRGAFDVVPWICGLWAVGLVAYQLYLLRFFRPAAHPAEGL